MFPFTTLLPLLLKSFISLITDWVFWIIVLLIAMQYKRMARTSRQLFDLPEEPVWRPAALATFFGIAGGFVGSILLIFVGISVLELGITYLWIAAVALMLIRQRFLCFAYAGGVLSLLKIFFGFPAVSVPQVMGLVAILHMVEALLILFSGHLEPLPVYVRTRQGQVVGGYNLQKFWPLPIVALLAWIITNQGVIQDAVSMPDWWPLIKTELLQGNGEPIYMMMPVVAALGYADIALAARPEEKTRRAALELAGYSVILLVLAIVASHQPVLSIIPALFGPLGHEFLIYTGQRREMKGEPIFVPPDRGIMVLHVLRNSPLKKAGVGKGAILLSLNGIPVDSVYKLPQILLEAGERLDLEYLTGKKREWKRAVLKRGLGEPLGFIPVPGRYESVYLEMAGSESLLHRWWHRFVGWFRSRRQ